MLTKRYHTLLPLPPDQHLGAKVEDVKVEDKRTAEKKTAQILSTGILNRICRLVLLQAINKRENVGYLLALRFPTSKLAIHV